MTSWTRIQSESRTFTRPLGQVECVFYWDSLYGGIADTASQFTVESSEVTAKELFSSENVSRAWLVIKKLHPLLGAIMQEREDGSWADFRIDERSLNALSPNEIVFANVDSEAEACQLVEETINREPQLSSRLLCQLWIVSQTQQGVPGRIVHHVFIHMRHSIMDGVAVYSLFKDFFDILSRRTVPTRYQPSVPLEEYLELHPPADTLKPSRRLSVPVQRWKKAIATVIHNQRLSKMRGGYTLPLKGFEHTPSSPLKSKTFHYQFTTAQSKIILTFCRQKGITLGNAFPVLLQLGHAKLAHRLYAEQLLSRSEWECMTTEPAYFSGPFNIRPYMDPTWFKNGGSTRCCAAVSWYETVLPHMPIARSAYGRVLKHPSFQVLSSEKRFLSRCQTVKKQNKKFFQHPLLVELAELYGSRVLRKSKMLADRWRAFLEPGRRELVEKHAPDYVYATESSNVGDLEPLIPTHYPLDNDRNDLISDIHIRSIRPYLRCRPEELYLTSIALNQQLMFVLFADLSAYDRDLVEELFGYVIEGALWYMGDGSKTERAHL